MPSASVSEEPHESPAKQVSLGEEGQGSEADAPRWGGAPKRERPGRAQPCQSRGKRRKRRGERKTLPVPLRPFKGIRLSFGHTNWEFNHL